MLEIVDKNFEEEVEKSNKPVLVDFFTDTCFPCRMLAPVLEEIAIEIPTVKFSKCNAVSPLCSELQEKFGIMSVPTLVLFLNGKETDRRIGSKTKSELINWIKDILTL